MAAKEVKATENGVINRIADKIVPKKEELKIAPLRQAMLEIPIIGETPLKILRFSAKGFNQMIATQEAGSQARGKKVRKPKDFKQLYEDAKYIGETDGKQWLGLNASGVRNGLIETCRMVGFAMTKAKMSLFAVADGYDILDSTPLCRIIGKERMVIDPARNASGVIDARARVCWDDWRIVLHIRFDEDQFSLSDVVNLAVRMGQQNGLGEGRPNGTLGNGTGNGVFSVDIDNCKIIRTQNLIRKSK